MRHVLDEEGGNGHVFVARPRLAQKAAALLDLPEDAADAAIDRLARLGDVALDASVVADARAPAVYEAGLYKAETALAAGLRRLLAAPAPGWRSIRRRRSPGTSARRGSRWRASRPRR